MAGADCVLDSLRQMDRHVERMGKATSAQEIVDAVRAYLSSWPPQRVECLQKIDGGWAPFDQYQRPAPVYGTIDILQICTSVHDQRLALSASGMELPQEFLELELFFFIASLMLENLEPDASKVRASKFLPRRERMALAAGR